MNGSATSVAGTSVTSSCVSTGSARVRDCIVNGESPMTIPMENCCASRRSIRRYSDGASAQARCFATRLTFIPLSVCRSGRCEIPPGSVLRFGVASSPAIPPLKRRPTPALAYQRTGLFERSGVTRRVVAAASEPRPWPGTVRRPADIARFAPAQRADRNRRPRRAVIRRRAPDRPATPSRCRPCARSRLDHAANHPCPCRTHSP